MANKGGASRRRFRVLPTVLLTVAILGLPTAVYAWGRTSSSFDIRHVLVHGADLVPRARVTKTLRGEYLGRNLFTVTGDDVRESLASYAYVEDARVDRDFPDTLEVTVIEHRPALYVLAVNGWFVVADDGFVIRKVGDAPDAALGAADGALAGASPSPAPSDTPPQEGAAPTPGTTSPSAGASGEPAATKGDTAATASVDITRIVQPSAALRQGPPHATLPLPAASLGGRLERGATVGGADVRAVLGVLAILPASLRRDVTVVQVGDHQDVALRAGDGLTIRWGDGQRALAKRLALGAVIRAYRKAGTRPTFIDVSVPDRVLARPILK